jgi:hypothetical protein
VRPGGSYQFNVGSFDYPAQRRRDAEEDAEELFRETQSCYAEEVAKLEWRLMVVEVFATWHFLDSSIRGRSESAGHEGR